MSSNACKPKPSKPNAPLYKNTTTSLLFTRCRELVKLSKHMLYCITSRGPDPPLSPPNQERGGAPLHLLNMPPPNRCMLRLKCSREEPPEHSIIEVFFEKMSREKLPTLIFTPPHEGGKGGPFKPNATVKKRMVLCLLMWSYEQTQPPAFFSSVAESWSNLASTCSTVLPLGAPTPRSLRQTRREGGPPYTS